MYGNKLGCHRRKEREQHRSRRRLPKKSRTGSRKKAAAAERKADEQTLAFGLHTHMHYTAIRVKCL